MAGGARRAASCRDQIVAGPVSISPPDWICPLLAIEWWHAEVRGDLRHHVNITQRQQRPLGPPRIGSIVVSRTAMSMRTLGARDSAPAMRPRLLAWAPLLDLGNISHGLLLPILVHCVDDQGHPCSDRP